LPDEESLKEFLEAFGEADDVFRIPDISTGEPGDRGYVRFKEHDSAVRCVEKGSLRRLRVSSLRPLS
jgi:RNA recognition motif-containing protein